jgi:hypothetical protein
MRLLFSLRVLYTIPKLKRLRDATIYIAINQLASLFFDIKMLVGWYFGTYFSTTALLLA